jgi:hypothetical protein
VASGLRGVAMGEQGASCALVRRAAADVLLACGSEWHIHRYSLSLSLSLSLCTHTKSVCVCMCVCVCVCVYAARAVRMRARTRNRARGVRVDDCTLSVSSLLDVSVPCVAGFSVHCVCWGVI